MFCWEGGGNGVCPCSFICVVACRWSTRWLWRTFTQSSWANCTTKLNWMKVYWKMSGQWTNTSLQVQCFLIVWLTIVSVCLCFFWEISLMLFADIGTTIHTWVWIHTKMLFDICVYFALGLCVLTAWITVFQWPTLCGLAECTIIGFQADVTSNRSAYFDTFFSIILTLILDWMQGIFS